LTQKDAGKKKTPGVLFGEKKKKWSGNPGFAWGVAKKRAGGNKGKKNEKLNQKNGLVEPVDWE